MQICCPTAGVLRPAFTHLHIRSADPASGPLIQQLLICINCALETQCRGEQQPVCCCCCCCACDMGPPISSSRSGAGKLVKEAVCSGLQAQ